jgi:hypothetical protein
MGRCEVAGLDFAVSCAATRGERAAMIRFREAPLRNASTMPGIHDE